jgi:hypothetical protein
MLGKIMKKKILLIPLVMLLLFAIVAPALAQKELVGVQVGDWFKYEAKVTQWVSTMTFLPDDYIGPLTLAENNTNAIWYTVTAITPDADGDTVTFTVQYDWKNGSTTYAPVEEIVSTADTMIFMIGANMTAGNMVSDTWDFLDTGWMYPPRYINETIDFANPNATRETNVLEYDINIFDVPYEYIFYYDKATGMRVWYWNHGDVPEIDFGTGEPQLAYEYTVVWELVDSSVNGLLIPDLTGPILLLMTMAITIPIVILHRRKSHLK